MTKKKSEQVPKVANPSVSQTEVIVLPKALMPLGEQKKEGMEKTQSPGRHYFLSIFNTTAIN